MLYIAIPILYSSSSLTFTLSQTLYDIGKKYNYLSNKADLWK